MLPRRAAPMDPNPCGAGHPIYEIASEDRTMDRIESFFLIDRQKRVPKILLTLLLFTDLFFCPFSTGRAQTNTMPPPRLNLLAAIRTTLASDPVVKLEEQSVKALGGNLQAASGQFDTTLKASLEENIDNRAIVLPGTPNAFSRLRQDQTTYRVSADKQLRSGILLSPGMEFTRFGDNTGQETLNRGSVNFLIQVPLARGFGRKATGAAERAARLDWEASKLNLRHTLSQRVLNTTIAYWNYAAAAERLRIVQEAENRARRLVEQIQALVKADEQSPSELDKLSANLANSTALRLSGEQALLEARNQLGIAMGIPFASIPQIPLPADLLPEFKPELLPQDIDVQKLSASALIHRKDIAAATKSQEAAAALLAGAKNGLKPGVDLTLKAGYAGAEGGVKTAQFFTPFGENIQGANGFAALSFDFPPANNTARGIYRQREAVYESSIIRAAELARSVQADVYVGLERLRTGAQQLNQSKLATDLYDKAVVNEKTKLSLSTATIIDVLSLEDRLTAASLNYVSAQRDYAGAIVDLRFLTGTLLQGEKDAESLSLEGLTTIPKVE